MAYDIIGDIHGHAERLEALLAKLGYRQRGNAWRHPLGRTAVFVGDLIDRGPDQARCVRMARAMIEAGSALMCAGNHEFAAIKFALVDPRSGDHYKARRANAVRHHASYLDAVGGADSALHRDHIAFFLGLPLWLDLPGVRIVHACPHPASLAALSTALPTRSFVDEAGFHRAMADDDVVDAVEKVVSGLEMALPAGHHFLDAQGQKRRKARALWWSANGDRLADVIEPVAMIPPLDDAPAPAGSTIAPDVLTAFGHYWIAPRSGAPFITADRAACLDFSVARGGPLAAYRFDGEPAFEAGRLAWV